MDNLSLPELRLLKSLLLGESLPTEAQTSIIKTLRTKAPDFLSQFTSDLTKAKLGDDLKVFEHLAKNRNRIQIALKKTGYFSTPQQAELVEAIEKSTAAEAVGQEIQPTEAGGSSAGGVPDMGMPSAPAISSAPRRVFVAPQTAPPENKEEETGEAAQHPAETDQSGEPNLPQTPSTNLPSESTVSTKAPAETKETEPTTNPTKGRFAKVTEKIQNFVERPKIWLKTNLGRVARGLRNASGRAARKLLGPRLASLFGRGLGLIMGRGLGLISSFGKLASLRTAISTALKAFIFSPTGLLIIGGVAFIAIFLMIIFSPNEDNSTEETTYAAYGLDYNLPLRDSSILPLNPESIKKEVRDSFKGSKVDEYWDKIIKWSQDPKVSLNPTLVLALWIEETGASKTTLAANGGGGVANDKGEFSAGHLGCAPEQDQTIDESLNCLFKFIAARNLTNNQFPDFMTAYSGGPANAPFSNNPNFPANIKKWYSNMVPSGPGAIQPLTGGTVLTASDLGCPAVGSIKTPYGYNIDNRLSTDEPEIKECAGYPKCHSGMDISNDVGTPVRSPISGNVSKNEEDLFARGSRIVVIQDGQTGFEAYFSHLIYVPNEIQAGKPVSKGQQIGAIGSAGYVHYELRQNDKLKNPFMYLGSSYQQGIQLVLAQLNKISENNYANTKKAEGRITTDYGACTNPPTYQPGAGKGIISCPLNGGYITTGSEGAPGGKGHCSTDYQKDYPCAVPDITGRATAADLEGSSKNVYLPYVNNEKVTWTIVEPNTTIYENEGGGVAIAATASSQGKTYTVRFVHLASSNLKGNETLNSADLIGQYLTHLHVTMKENGEFQPADLYFNLCQ